MFVVMMANLAEFLYTVTKLNLKLLYIFGIPAAFAVLFNGGVPRILASTIGRLYLLFVGFMGAAIPFSVWIGGSLEHVVAYLTYVLPMFLIFGGIISGWRQVRGAMAACAIGGVFVVLQAYLFRDMTIGRLMMKSSGTIGNSNDLAAHLLMLLPIVMYVALDKQRNWLFRLVASCSIPLGLIAILQTASRGALLAVVLTVLFYLGTSRFRNQLKLIVVIGVLAVGALAVLPDAVLTRITDFGGETSSDTSESTKVRGYMFWESVRQSIRRPLFGVGPGQFATGESMDAAGSGRRGVWLTVHCTWTQVSSECGLPALLSLLGAIGLAFVGFYRSFRRAQALGLDDVALASHCMMLSFVGFFVAISFMPFAYRFQVAALIGFAIPFNAATHSVIQARLASSRTTSTPER
jgi:O-antigen ligase